SPDVGPRGAFRRDWTSGAARRVDAPPPGARAVAAPRYGRGDRPGDFRERIRGRGRSADLRCALAVPRGGGHRGRPDRGDFPARRADHGPSRCPAPTRGQGRPPLSPRAGPPSNASSYPPTPCVGAHADPDHAVNIATSALSGG